MRAKDFSDGKCFPMLILNLIKVIKGRSVSSDLAQHVIGQLQLFCEGETLGSRGLIVRELDLESKGCRFVSRHQHGLGGGSK